MSYTARESSRYSGQPYELFLFQTGDQTWRLSSGDQQRTYMGQVFEPTSITHTEPNQGTEIKSGSMTLELPLDHEIALLFRSYIPISPLWLTIFRAHDGEPDTETVTFWTGKVAKATFGAVCELECVPEQQALKKSIPGPRFQPMCNRILFDPGCTVPRGSYTLVGALDSVDGDTVLGAVFGSKPSGWLKNGYLEWNGERRTILDHTGTRLVLSSGVAMLAAGAQVTVYAGCKRTSIECQTKFSNGQNFFGFEWIPVRNPFNGVG